MSFEYIIGKLFIPLTYLMGVPSQDCESVARLLGLKTIVNEFAAYQRLGEMVVKKQIGRRAQVHTLSTNIYEETQKLYFSYFSDSVLGHFHFCSLWLRQPWFHRCPTGRIGCPGSG